MRESAPAGTETRATGGRLPILVVLALALLVVAEELLELFEDGGGGGRFANGSGVFDRGFGRIRLGGRGLDLLEVGNQLFVLGNGGLDTTLQLCGGVTQVIQLKADTEERTELAEHAVADLYV